MMAGSIAQWLAYLRPDPAAPGSIPSFTGILSVQKIIDVAEAIPWRRLEESERWLENVDRTHQYWQVAIQHYNKGNS